MPSAFSEATAEVGSFEEAIDWFRARFPVTEELLAALGEYAGERAWTIAAVTSLEAVREVHQLLAESIELSRPLRETVDLLQERLSAYGFAGHRLETIALTNTASAYNAGRYRQLSDPILISARPWRQFDGIEDSRQSDTCQERNEVTLHANDPWWLTNWPPLHHRCRSQVRSLSAREVEGLEISQLQVPHGIATPSEGFGLTPDIALAWRPDLHRYPPDLRDVYLSHAQAAEAP